MRCPDCNKFVSMDADQEPEITANVEDDGSIGVEARIFNACADCGTELKEANFSMEDQSLVEELAEHKAVCTAEGGMRVSVKDEAFARTDRRGNLDRHGKPIRNPRYQKQYYGVEGTVTVECACGEEFGPVNFEDEIQASGMDELV